MWFLLVLPLFIGTKAQMVSQNGDKCSKQYICPPEFLRLNQNCYFFSKNTSTWDEAFFSCQDLHGRLAILRNANQDKMIRSFLSKVSLVSVERWIGGRFDWEQMTWKWGQSGHEINYRGFSRMDPDDREKLQWHCIVLDPELQYKWNARSCLEKKHFICQTKLKKATPDEKEKLRKKYNNKLNEVPLPEITNSISREIGYKEHVPNGINMQDDSSANEVLKQTSFAFTNSTALEFANSSRRKSKRFNRTHMLKDGTIVLKQASRRRIGDLHKQPQIEKIHTKIYYGNLPKSPLHPRIITEEIGFP